MPTNPGPLVDVDTVVGGINLDVSRQLRLGPEATFEFIVSSGDPNDPWTVLATYINNFDRISGDEQERGNARTVIYQIADTDNRNIGETIRNKGLYARCKGQINQVDHTDEPAENEAQIYTVHCKARTAQDTYFTTGRNR